MKLFKKQQIFCVSCKKTHDIDDPNCLDKKQPQKEEIEEPEPAQVPKVKKPLVSKQPLTARRKPEPEIDFDEVDEIAESDSEEAEEEEESEIQEAPQPKTKEHTLLDFVDKHVVEDGNGNEFWEYTCVTCKSVLISVPLNQLRFIEAYENSHPTLKRTVKQ